MKKMKKILIILFFILYIINPVNASLLFFNQQYNSAIENITSEGFDSDAAYSMLLVELPERYLRNVSFLTNFKIKIGSGYWENNQTYPSGDKLYFKMYKKTLTGWQYAGYASYINNNTYYDYGTVVNVNFMVDFIIEKGYNYGIAFYSNAPKGGWSILGATYFLAPMESGELIASTKWHTTNPSVCQYNQFFPNYHECTFEQITQKIHRLFPETEITVENGFSINMEAIWIEIYGQTEIPSTPEPTPAPILEPSTNPTSQNISGECGNYFDNSTQTYIPIACENMLPLPNFNNSGSFDFSNPETACPSCLGNETITGKSKMGNDKQASKFMKTFGYCSSSGCGFDDIMNFIYDFAILLFVVSLFFMYQKFSR